MEHPCSLSAPERGQEEFSPSRRKGRTRMPNRFISPAAFLLRRTCAALTLVSLLFLGAPLVEAQSFTVDPRITSGGDAADYPDANAVLLLDDIRFDVRPDRTHIFEEHDAIKILTLEGVDENGTLDRVLDSSHTEIEVLMARTVKANGRIINAAPPEITPLVRESELYAPMKRFSIRFPDVEVGDVVEFHLRTVHQPKPGGHFWATTYVENPMPIADTTFTVTIPKDVYFQTATPGNPELKAKEEAVRIEGTEYRRLHWHVQDQKAFEARPLAPSTLSLLQRIEVSSFRSWEEVATYVGQLWATHSTLSEGLSLRIAGWLPASNDIAVRARAILKELSHKRKVASFLAEGIVFHRPSAVFPEELISLPDSSLLLSVALTVAGVPNIPVASLGENRALLAKELPNPEKIDRIVLQIPGRHGHSYWVDPESPGFLLEAPPSGTPDTAVLSWDARFAGASKGLVDLAPGSALASREELAVEGRLERNGRAELNLQFDRYGGAAVNARQAARDIGDGARGVRERALDSFFNNAALAYGERARLLGRFFESDPEASDPFSLAFTLAVPGFGRVEGDLLTVPLPRFLSSNIRAAALEKGRGEIPLRFERPYQQDVRVHLIFPEGSTVLDAPARIEKKTPQAEFVATGRAEGNEVWYVGRLTVLDPWVDPPELKSALSVLGSAIESEDTAIKVSLAPSRPDGPSEEEDEG